ncbi:MAG: MoaD/ThiS family protein [Bacteroidales bacterium]|jgi:molybdopterin converting factor small subunit|nr:MoaD/ThiS family protein [Bacteroidales bacterium]MCU0407325.1 MoaD/ThiS family protein [Bacteroidales bacterium]
MAKVIFFGVLTDVAGTRVRHFNGAASVKELLLLIEGEYPEIIHYDYRIAVNNEFIDGDLPLSESDEVSFMPPFAGG